MHCRPSLGRQLLAIVAVVAAALVTGCTTRASDAALEPTVGRAQNAARAEIVAGTSSARIAAGGLELSLPAGLTLAFDDAPSGDPDTEAMLNDSAALFAAIYQAIGRGDPEDSLYRRFAGGSAERDLATMIKMFPANDWTVTGQARVFERKAVRTGADSGRVSWCADVRQVYPQEIGSGTVLPVEASDAGLVAYTGTVRRNSAGIWILTSIRSERAAAACIAQPARAVPPS